jgi:Carboxypeptidase regulatory-like domain
MTANDDVPGGDGPSSPSSAIPPFADWVQQVRSQTEIDLSPAKPNTQPSRRRRQIGAVLFLLAMTGVGWSLFALMNQTQSPAGVHGRLRDPRNRPVAGAYVFLTSDPTIATNTDQDGGFQLLGVPRGNQTLVIAQSDMGQEYRINVTDPASTDMGELVFHVPPLSIRRMKGSGVGWTGEEPTEWLARRQNFTLNARGALGNNDK